MNSPSEAADFTAQLIEYALKNKHREFEFILSLAGYRAAKLVYSSNKKVAKVFKKEAKHQYKLYVDKLGTGKANLQNLMNSKMFSFASDFYAKESEQIWLSIAEFRTYCTNPISAFKALLGYSRTEEEIASYYSEELTDERDDLDI